MVRKEALFIRNLVYGGTRMPDYCTPTLNATKETTFEVVAIKVFFV